ncbi:MAG: LysE family translocator [Gammaproteobacteria bacterium]|nr:LysE family translocator [Gammaproteobacteria bacterium]MBU2678029.1 LysE family translocator [Gammaproteobacteria bacterium]NNC55995.1 LysE family translocator [Woeseiaceae bacterium]NNL51764.1 LysE family translocator [Woeseiaceae bacterium]
MSPLLALVVATAVLVMIPGPNVALIVANSLKYGFRTGVVTVLGTTTGVALQLLLVVVGMAAVIELAAGMLTWIRWAGVAYLVWLGIRTWREPADDLALITAAPAMFWRGCILAAINPKTLLFNAAFIPQFVATGSASLVNVALVAAVFLTVVLLGDLLWAAFATSARRVLSRYSGWRNRLTGAFLTAAGIGLALARR